MSGDSWWAQVWATVGRRTPAYQAAGVGVRLDGSWLRQVAATVARQTPAFRAAFGGRPRRRVVMVRPRRVADARVVAAAREAARGVVALVALPELLAFDVVSDAFFARSRRRFAGAGHLAFGDRRAGAGTRMTPVVLTAASMAVEHLIRVGHQDGGRISERDCAEIRRIVGDVARDAGVEGTTATRIAEALIETLRDDS